MPFIQHHFNHLRCSRHPLPDSAAVAVSVSDQGKTHRDGVLLDLHVGFVQKRARVCKFWGKAMLGDKLACEVNFTAMIADPPAS